MTGYVYAIRSVDLIKIGWSRDPHKRIVNIATSCFLPVELAGCRIGSKEDEAAFHKKWRKHRQHGEWFHCAPEIVKEVSGWDDVPAKRTKQITGSPLRVWRKAKGLNATELAGMVGCEQSFLSKVERYKAIPSLKVYLGIRRVTEGEITFDDLIDPALLSSSLKRKGEAA